MSQDAPDTTHSAMVTDHHFVPPEEQPWGLCQVWVEEKNSRCLLGLASHRHGPVEDTDPGRPPSMRPYEDRNISQGGLEATRSLQCTCTGIDGIHAENCALYHEQRPTPFPVHEIDLSQEKELTTGGGVQDTYIPGAGTTEDAQKEVKEHLNPPQIKADVKVFVDREEIIKSFGHKDDSGKPGFFYLPWVALEDVARVMEYGAKKYAPGNYQKGMNHGRYFSALIRHMKDWWMGEDIDPESNLPHLAHAACCVLMLLENQKMQKGNDNRYVE